MTIAIAIAIATLLISIVLLLLLLNTNKQYKAFVMLLSQAKFIVTAHTSSGTVAIPKGDYVIYQVSNIIYIATNTKVLHEIHTVNLKTANISRNDEEWVLNLHWYNGKELAHLTFKLNDYEEPVIHRIRALIEDSVPDVAILDK